jgi:hypothetical protein
MAVLSALLAKRQSYGYDDEYVNFSYYLSLSACRNPTMLQYRPHNNLIFAITFSYRLRNHVANQSRWFTAVLATGVIQPGTAGDAGSH